MSTKRFTNALVALALLVGLAAGGLLAPSAPANAQDAGGGRSVPLVASAARTATGTGTAACGFGPFDKFAAQLVVTAASGTTPTLDVTWQHSIDGGTTWYTVAAFTQRTATGQELKAEAEVEAATAEVYGDCFRAIWTIGGTTPSFTFAVDVYAQ
jgi:hypothetical protein